MICEKCKAELKETWTKKGYVSKCEKCKMKYTRNCGHKNQFTDIDGYGQVFERGNLYQRF